ncbi:MAG: type II toxin-antitoxin system VapC family toxin [Dehalococcoidales bacterium]|nr:type II toxin-antitoxin system VapC family toxin [Dehalococcoidales bacterium]
MSKFHLLLLDSSVVVKWFRSESTYDKALAIQQAFLSGDLDLGISELTLYEVANALRYSGDYTADEIRESLNSILDLEITVYPFSFDALASGVQRSFDTNISIYDAYLVELAKALRSTLVTADNKLLARLSADDHVVSLSAWN